MATPPLHPPSVWPIRLAALCAAALLVGCAARTPAPSPALAELTWPQPPGVVRVGWLQELREPEDLGVQRGFWARVADRVLGRAPEPFLVRPTGIDVTDDGRLLVTDTGTRRVLLIDLVRHRVQRIPADRKEHLPSPIDAAMAPDGTILVTDSALGRVVRFDDQGRNLGDLGSPGVVERPTGIAVDAQRQRIYVADTTAHQIVVFRPGGEVQRILGHRGGQAGEFNFPTHLCLDREGNLYVTDAMNFRIQVLDPDGRAITTVGRLGDGPGTFAKPKGVAVDSEGHIYVVDALFDNVQILSRDDRPLLAFGHSGSGPGAFWLPAGIAIDPADRIFIADTYNRRIQLFQFHSGQDGQ